MRPLLRVGNRVLLIHLISASVSLQCPSTRAMGARVLIAPVSRAWKTALRCQKRNVMLQAADDGKRGKETGSAHLGATGIV